MYNDMRKNGEGYADPTPYKALSEPREGEIWESGSKEYLILQCHEGVNTVLGLIDEDKEGCVEIRSRSKRYTNPAMLQYLWANNPGDFVRKLSDTEFQAVLDSVRKAFPVLAYARNSSDDAEEAKLADLEYHIEFLEEKLDAAQERLTEAERAVIKSEMRTQVYEEMYENLLGKLINSKE